jgi:hypothetical protein
MDDRQRKRDSARKKSEFSVYSQKAVRAKENLQRAKPVVVQKSSDNGPYGPIGQNLCVAKVKDAAKTKETKK